MAKKQLSVGLSAVVRHDDGTDDRRFEASVILDYADPSPRWLACRMVERMLDYARQRLMEDLDAFYSVPPADPVNLQGSGPAPIVPREG